MSGSDTAGWAPETHRLRPKLTSLYKELQNPLLYYAHRLTRNGNTAQEIVQEAFMKLASEINRVDEPKGWLFRTVHNLALNRLRKERREDLVDPASMNALKLRDRNDGCSPDEELARWEELKRLKDCVESLDNRLRQLVELRFYEGLSYAQISERTGLTVGYVGYLLHQALKMLAQKYTKGSE